MNTDELYVAYLDGTPTWLIYGQDRVAAYETAIELAGADNPRSPSAVSITPATEHDAALWTAWVATHDPIPNYVAIAVPIEKAEALV